MQGVISLLLLTLVIIYSMQVLTPGITGALNLISTERTHRDHDDWIVYFPTRPAELRTLD